MRLLLDECVTARLRKALPSHQVSTVPQEGWSGVKNGKLLALAAKKFDTFTFHSLDPTNTSSGDFLALFEDIHLLRELAQDFTALRCRQGID